MFALLLGVTPSPSSRDGDQLPDRQTELAEPELFVAGALAPVLAAPRAEELLQVAGIESIASAPSRKSVLAAMRAAAERRLTGVTGEKRRRHYGYAADLVAVCLRCEPSPETQGWVTVLETEHRRFPALRRELDRALNGR